MQGKKDYTIRLRGGLMDFSTPRVMGIINATPDSFYAGSRSIGRCGAVATAMLADGADILDIGAFSTRPGADEVSADEEYSRLAAALEDIRHCAPDAVISVDTFRADIARKVVGEFNVDIINDIGGGTLDPEMRDTVAELGVPYILMHTRGTPSTMQQLTDYSDVCADVLSDLAFKVDDFRQAGVHDIIVDPGFGFAKTVGQNYSLLAALDIFHQTGCPVLAGLSRKTMLWKPLGITPEEAGDATVAANTLAIANGADILRVHDVRPAVQACRIFSLLSRNAPSPFEIRIFDTQQDPLT